MDEDVDVIIASYGDIEKWALLISRATISVLDQTVSCGFQQRHFPGDCDLSFARNCLGRESKADWLIFLDADDELDTGYVEAMLGGDGDLRWPSTLGVYPSGRTDDFPVLLQPKPSILFGNHMVIGTMVRRELFSSVGGFREGLPVLEDWDLWIRCLRAGAVARPCPEAVYRVHVRQGSRNTDQATHDYWYREIQGRYQGKP